jgi:Zn-dependent M28 family amino/carboxypeptidase
MWQHMGSLVYARAARKRGDRIRLMISLEMLGYYSSKPGSQLYPPLFRFFYPDRAEFIAFVSNLRSRRLMHRAVQVFRTHSDFPLEHTTSVALVRGVAASDHFSFWRQGYPAFMVTDTAYYRYPYYHTAFDTPDKLCYQPFADLTYGLCQTFNSLASGALD